MPKRQPFLKFINNVMVLLLLVATCYSCSQRGALPQLVDPPSALYKDPLQTPLKSKPPFDVKENGITYIITPHFNYTLSGMIVSKKDHDSGLITSLHRRWKDYLNTADICLIWGKNLDINLADFEFWNRQFTCFYQTYDREALKTFDGQRLSNNHLLVQDDYLRKQILRLNVGDVVTLRGWLSDYKNLETGGKRTTSTIRTDTGNGACETIWVTDVERLQAHIDPWHRAYLSCVAMLVFSILFWFWGVGTGRY